MSILYCLEIVVTKDCIDTLIGILFQQVTYGWEEEEVSSYETIFRVHSDNRIFIESLVTTIRQFLPNSIVHVKQVPVQDWSIAWRKFFTPVEAGQFLVLPPWLVGTTISTNLYTIIIEPKCAFGTGHHASTVLCLEALSYLAREKYIRSGMQFFDLGTGSGILGIACAHLGLIGLGADIDPIAVSNAQENSICNNVSERFSIIEAGIEAGTGRVFDLIIANILAEPLKIVAPNIITSLASRGSIILSGLLNNQADDVEAAYIQLGKAHRMYSGDWVALIWHTG